MKKAKLLSVFLSLTLGMTVLTAMPVTASTVSSPVNTDTENEQTISFEYSFHGGWYTDLINESFEVSFIKRKVVYTESGEKEYIGEEEILETWDNAISNPHKTAKYTYDKDYEYAVKADKLPENMTVDYKDSLYVPTYYYEFEPDISEINDVYHIRLQKWENDIPKLPISTNIEGGVSVNISDAGFQMNMKNLDITVYTLNNDMSEKEEIAHFITENENNIISVPCDFNDINDKVMLKFKINNMPEGYKFYQDGGKYETIRYFTCMEYIDSVGKGYTGTYQFNLGITLEGDANCDSELSMADSVLIMQSLANPDKYGENGTDEHHITDNGKKNADIAGDNDGITNADALAIQKKLLKLD